MSSCVRRLVSAVTSVLAGVMLFSTFSAFSVSADTSKDYADVTVQGDNVILTDTVTYSQSTAREMIGLVNSYRTSGRAWYWNADNITKKDCGVMKPLALDANLERIAMQRAVEIALCFAHKRPDGTYFDTCVVDGVNSYGENITMTQPDEIGAYTTWLEEGPNDMYEDQSHRREMFNAGYRAVGIAHAVVNGIDCYVMEFGFEVTTPVIPDPFDGEMDVSVNIPNDRLRIVANVDQNLKYFPLAFTYDAPVINAGFAAEGVWEYSPGFSIDPSLLDVTWINYDPSAIQVIGDKIRMIKAGTYPAQALVTYGNYSDTVDVWYKADPASLTGQFGATVDTIVAQPYTGRPVIPEINVTYHGLQLVYGVDYTVECTNNVEVNSIADIDIIGMGSYYGTISEKFLIVEPSPAPTATVAPTQAATPTTVATPTEAVTPTTVATPTEAVTPTTIATPTEAVTPTTIATPTEVVTPTTAVTPTVEVTPTTVATPTVEATPTTMATPTEAVMPTATTAPTATPVPVGWQRIGGVVYYYDRFGDMYIGLRKIDNDYYFFEDSGAMHTGWLTLDGERYYFNSDGVMSVGKTRIGSGWYYFDAFGILKTGWITIDNDTYFADDTGLLARATPTPVATNTPIPTVTNTPRPTATNTPVPTAVPTTHPSGWQSSGSNWYYYGPDGAKVTSWQKIKGVWYYFDSNGLMKTGWVKSGNIWYYMNSSGAMVSSNWVSSGGKWYYMDANGAMVTSNWVLSGGKWYYMNADGTMKTSSWIKSNNEWYYLKASGEMAVGWVKVGSDSYYFFSSGVMAHSTWIGKYYVDSSGRWTNTK